MVFNLIYINIKNNLIVAAIPLMIVGSVNNCRQISHNHILHIYMPNSSSALIESVCSAYASLNDCSCIRV
jgi:hypothetical protein